MSAQSNKDVATEAKDLDVAKEAKDLAENTAYATRMVQKIGAQLGRLPPGPDREKATNIFRLMQQVEQLLKGPVAILTHPDVVNAVEGLTSADPKQRSGFEALASLIGNVPFQDIMPILALLPRAKRQRGRRRGSTIRGDADLIRKMKILVGQGMSISKAALQFADQARMGGTPRSTAKRLARKFRLGEK